MNMKVQCHTVVGRSDILPGFLIIAPRIQIFGFETCSKIPNYNLDQKVRGTLVALLASCRATVSKTDFNISKIERES